MIDCHAHFLTDSYVAAVDVAHPDGMPGWPAYDPVEHLALMDQWGISRAMLSISSPGVRGSAALAREVNEDGAALRRAHPDRFGHFASLPLPDVAAALAEARHALDVLGSDGVVVETNAEGRYLGHESYAELWAELDRRAAVVFVHPTSPVHADGLTAGRPAPMLEFLFDTARAVADLALTGVFARHPDIRWILPHGGGVLPLVATRVDLFGRFFGEGSDLAEQLRRVWFDVAGTPYPQQVPALERAFGLDRVVYGSDSCWTPPPLVTAQLATLGDLRDRLARNALDLFDKVDA